MNASTITNSCFGDREVCPLTHERIKDIPYNAQFPACTDPNVYDVNALAAYMFRNPSGANKITSPMTNVIISVPDIQRLFTQANKLNGNIYTKGELINAMTLSVSAQNKLIPKNNATRTTNAAARPQVTRPQVRRPQVTAEEIICPGLTDIGITYVKIPQRSTDRDLPTVMKAAPYESNGVRGVILGEIYQPYTSIPAEISPNNGDYETRYGIVQAYSHFLVDLRRGFYLVDVVNNGVNENNERTNDAVVLFYKSTHWTFDTRRTRFEMELCYIYSERHQSALFECPIPHLKLGPPIWNPQAGTTNGTLSTNNYSYEVMINGQPFTLPRDRIYKRYEEYQGYSIHRIIESAAAVNGGNIRRKRLPKQGTVTKTSSAKTTKASKSLTQKKTSPQKSKDSSTNKTRVQKAPRNKKIPLNNK